MSFERTAGIPAEPAPPAGAPGFARGADGPTPVQVRVQILATEHWSLLASRNLAWNESFTRASMFLSTLSASIVALGLIAGVSGFEEAFFAFALTILPVVLFVGIGTWLRMGAANYHDAMTIYGMNRIRGAYLEIAPELEPYFVMGTHDDPRGIGITMAVPPNMPPFVHLISATPALVVVLNGVVAGAIAAIGLGRFAAASGGVSLAVGALIAVIVIAVQMAYARRSIESGRSLVQPLFPTPEADQSEGHVYGAMLGITDRTPPDGPSPGASPGPSPE